VVKRKALQTAGGPALAALIQFANLRTIDSTRQVEGIFVPAAAALGATRFQTLRSSAAHVAAYAADQAALRRWLVVLLRGQQSRKADRAAALAEVASWASKARPVRTFEVKAGRIARVERVELDGMQALIGEVMQRLFTAEDLRGLIGQCPQCKNYYVRRRIDQQLCSGRCRTARLRANKKAQGAIA